MISSLALLAAVAVQPAPLALIPAPQSVQAQAGVYTLKPGALIVADQAALNAASLVARDLEPAFGSRFQVATKGRNPAIKISLNGNASLGPEGYTLTIGKSGVEIKAKSPAGAFYGLQTVRQLLPADVFSTVKQDRAWTLPYVQITDSPRFGWRGSMMDSCRHFMPKEFVKKYIDQLSQMKINTFHWHLTDDQGWRIEIKRYPKLTSVGAWRKNVDEQKADQPHKYRYQGMFSRPDMYGGYYTQEEIREIVAYAADRHVTIVPEIEMPGHASAAIAAYPELGNFPDKQREVVASWGVMSGVFNVEDSTVKFLQNVLDEVVELFPSRFIHIGGDEAPKTEWEQSPRAQELMKQRGLKDEHELQSWFIRQMDRHLTAKGRKLIGWSEILEGGLAENAAVMSWLGTSGGIQAARTGHDAVMAPTSHTYLDYYQSADRSREPQAIGGHVPLYLTYRFEPIPAELEPQFHHHILGVQGQIWTEYIQHPKQFEYMAFPRMCAIAEVGWSPKSSRDFKSFMARLEGHLPRLERQDVMFRRPDASQWPAELGWTPETLAAGTLRWDVSKWVSQPGQYRVTFAYTHGSHGAEMSQVRLAQAGSFVLTSPLSGFAGHASTNHTHTFNVKSLGAGEPVWLSAQMVGRGGGDSAGEIRIERVGNAVP